MVASFDAYAPSYIANWANLKIRPERLAEADKEAHHVLAGQARYQKIEARTQVPWWFIGLTHYRESHFNFGTYLGNGQTLARVTTIVPKGRGPFTGENAFEDGAVDALRLMHFLGLTDWSLARSFYRIEGFNGYGYHGKTPSPYLYGGSTIYERGKYVADHNFDPNFKDTQLGVLVILKRLCELDPSIAFGASASAGHTEPDDHLAHAVLWVQQTLNHLHATPQLTEDGMAGPATMGAVSAFQKTHGLPDTGLPDAATVSALEKALVPVPPAATQLGKDGKPAPAPAPAPAAPRPAPAGVADAIKRLLHAVFG